MYQAAVKRDAVWSLISQLRVIEDDMHRLMSLGVPIDRSEYPDLTEVANQALLSTGSHWNIENLERLEGAGFMASKDRHQLILYTKHGHFTINIQTLLPFQKPVSQPTIALLV